MLEWTSCVFSRPYLTNYTCFLTFSWCVCGTVRCDWYRYISCSCRNISLLLTSFAFCEGTMHYLHVVPVSFTVFTCRSQITSIFPLRVVGRALKQDRGSGTLPICRHVIRNNSTLSGTNCNYHAPTSQRKTTVSVSSSRFDQFHNHSSCQTL